MKKYTIHAIIATFLACTHINGFAASSSSGATAATAAKLQAATDAAALLNGIALTSSSSNTSSVPIRVKQEPVNGSTHTTAPSTTATVPTRVKEEPIDSLNGPTHTATSNATATAGAPKTHIDLVAAPASAAAAIGTLATTGPSATVKGIIEKRRRAALASLAATNATKGSTNQSFGTARSPIIIDDKPITNELLEAAAKDFEDYQAQRTHSASCPPSPYQASPHLLAAAAASPATADATATHAQVLARVLETYRNDPKNFWGGQPAQQLRQQTPPSHLVPVQVQVLFNNAGEPIYVTLPHHSLQETHHAPVVHNHMVPAAQFQPSPSFHNLHISNSSTQPNFQPHHYHVPVMHQYHQQQQHTPQQPQHSVSAAAAAYYQHHNHQYFQPQPPQPHYLLPVPMPQPQQMPVTTPPAPAIAVASSSSAAVAASAAAPNNQTSKKIPRMTPQSTNADLLRALEIRQSLTPTTPAASAGQSAAAVAASAAQNSLQQQVVATGKLPHRITIATKPQSFQPTTPL